MLLPGSKPFVVGRRGIVVVLIGLCLGILHQGSVWADPLSDKTADVVAKVRPSVVRIVTSQPPVRPPAGGGTTNANGNSTTAFAFGSGFIIDPQGYVATNRHVVDRASAVFVITASGARHRADLVIMAPRSDVALVHFTPNYPLRPVVLGDSDKMRVGDPVIAIGNPFGFDESVSAGIVSATNRNMMDSPFDDYIQTDAAINHGNSGGPLFNLSGEVIGMNTLIYAPTTGSAGVAFAIPSSLLSVVLPRLKDYHHGMPGRLPLQTQDVSQVLAAALDAPKPGGAAVVTLTNQADSLKDKVQPGDIVQSFDGLPVLDSRDLARKAIKTAVGSKVTLGFYRGSEKKEAVVEIVPLADSLPTVRHMPRPKTLGLHLISREQGTDPAVIIGTIDESGSAADSGLRKNDQILQVDRDVVDTVDGAMAALNARIQAKRGYAAVLLQRDKTKQWTALALPD